MHSFQFFQFSVPNFQKIMFFFKQKIKLPNEAAPLSTAWATECVR